MMNALSDTRLALVAAARSWMTRLGGSNEAQQQSSTAPENIYHCCIHKTASQWIARILAAPETFAACGLKTHCYQQQLPGGADERNITDRVFSTPFPRHRIITPVYISRENFLSLPKPHSWRAFVVVRDPRDILVSWYFSWKHSHPLMGDVAGQREKFNSLSHDDGLCRAIDRLQEWGLFAALSSWFEHALPISTSVAIFRYEDLVSERQFETFQRLFAHCGIRMPDRRLARVLAANSFSALTNGRQRGVENINSHLRKGIPGDWKNHFSPCVTDKFRRVTGDLVSRLGYE